MIVQDKKLLAGAAGVILAAGVVGFGIARLTASSPTEEAAKEEGEEHHSETIVLANDAVASASIGVTQVVAGGLGSELVTQGLVTAMPSGEALVTARAAGAVTRVFKRLGDPVRAGETLAIVESRDAAQITADRSAAAARATLAQRNLARERYLYEQKVSARVEYERAQAEAAAASAEALRAQVAGRAANVTRDGRGVAVTSPISGRISTQSVALGAFVQPETELFRVSDPRQVQVEAAISPMDMSRIALGDIATIELPDGRTLEGRVRSVTPAVNATSRSATAVIEVAGAVQPGLSVRVRLRPSIGDRSSAIVVPEEAVQTLEGRDVVFVRTSNGFRPQTVTLGRRSAGRVEIVSGLEPGKLIATRNAFLLKAELGKGEGEEH